MVSMVIGFKTLLKPNSHDCTLALILEPGWLRTSLSMSRFRDKQHTLVKRVGVPKDAGSSPSKKEACQIYDPTTKLIILRRSPKTSLWDSCGRYCIQKEIINKKF